MNTFGVVRITLLLLCTLIGFGLMIAMLGALMQQRRQARRAHQKPFHVRLVVELIWAVIPLMILVAMAMPALHRLITG